jgi:hypothetical protein
VSNGPDQPEPSEQDPYAASSPPQPPPDDQPPPAYGQPDSPYGQPPPPYGQPATQYGQQAPYGQPTGQQPPPYGYPPQGYTAAAGTNGLAIASLICAFFCTPLGLIFGLVAKSQIKRTGQSGNGLATAGIVISLVSIVFSLVWVLVVAGHSS